MKTITITLTKLQSEVLETLKQDFDKTTNEVFTSALGCLLNYHQGKLIHADLQEK